MPYAIIEMGGKQYRVEKGDSLLVDRVREDEGAKVSPRALLYSGDGEGQTVFEGADLDKVKVEATVVGHERGPKIRVLKFKPKRGYKRRTGHRQELTRLEVTAVKLAARKPAAKKADAAKDDAEKPAAKKSPAKSKGEDQDDS